MSNITIANNGEEAIEIMEQESEFDIVLMDIQMPVMDGLECTKKLREKGFNIPIVALTANAFKEDQELYLESGMNTYLSKPYSELELIQKISETTNIKSSIEVKAAENVPKKLPKVMYNLFVEEMTKNIKLFTEHIIMGDLQATNKLAHKIKSNLKMFGLGEWLPLCMKIEKSLEINESDIKQLCSCIREKIDEFRLLP